MDSDFSDNDEAFELNYDYNLKRFTNDGLRVKLEYMDHTESVPQPLGQPDRATVPGRRAPPDYRLLPNLRARSPVLPLGYLSPAASPDEMITQRRGLPITWYPDNDFLEQLDHNTPCFSTNRTPRNLAQDRSSPQKLDGPSRSTPEKLRKSHEPKKIDSDHISTSEKDQVFKLIEGPMIKHEM